MKTPIFHVYFDMDGVLARFIEEDSVTKPFLVPGSGYFRNLPPDTRAVDLMRCVDEFPRVHTHVLTRLLRDIEPGIAGEHEADKLAWCRAHRLTRDFDGPGQGSFICIRHAPDKNAVLETVPRPADRKLHVLVDDDPRILRAWEQAGGTGFLYIQSHRTVNRSYDTDRVLHGTDQVPAMANKILTIAYKNTKGSTIPW